MSSNVVLPLYASMENIRQAKSSVGTISIPSVGTARQWILQQGATQTGAVGEQVFWSFRVPSTSTFILYANVSSASISFSLWDNAGNMIIAVNNATALTAYPLTLQVGVVYELRIDYNATAAVGSALVYLAAARTLSLASLMNTAGFLGPPSLGAGESFTQNTTGAILTLNRNVIASSEFEVFGAGPMLLSGSYTITSSQPSIIPSQSGSFTAGQTLSPFAIPSTTSLFQGTLTITFANIGSTQPLDIQMLSAA